MKDNIYGAMNILIYDKNNLKYYNGVLTTIGIEPNIEQFGCDSIIFSHDINIQVPSIEEYNNIELDDTLMKRIAKFNKEQECLRLDEKIKKKKEQIKKIEEVLNDRTKRLKKLKDFICDIYDIDIYDEYDE